MSWLDGARARLRLIGVMPRGFAFPINNRVWTPLRLQPSDFERGHAPPIEVFGRLALGATLADVERQLTTIGQRLAAAYPESHEHIRPRVLSYTRAAIDTPDLDWIFHLIQLLFSMVLVVIGTNVAILVYARTASRAGEIAVRTALGASRGRIVAQLFAEGLVLSAVAAGIGVAVARFSLQQIESIVHAHVTASAHDAIDRLRMGGDQIPFWMHFSITPATIAYVAGLAILASVLVGVVPALKATRSRVSSNLQQLAGSGSGMRLGRTWTALIVAQVAVAVAVLPVAVAGIGDWVRAAGRADRVET